MMDLSSLHRKLPEILASRRRRVSRLLTVEELDLSFASGVRTYERLVGGRGAVLAVPFDGKDFYLISEYACGSESYELGFVKGKIDAGETPEAAVCRELKEEIGFGCRRTRLLRRSMTVAPEMMTLVMYCFLCEDLFPGRLEGDEPEPLGLIRVSVAEARELLYAEDSPLREARAVAALALALERIRGASGAA